jgi:hypothetical protein
MPTAQEGHILRVKAEHVVMGRGFVVKAEEFGMRGGDLPGWFTVEPMVKDSDGVQWGCFTPTRPLLNGEKLTGWVYLDMGGHEIVVEL